MNEQLKTIREFIEGVHEGERLPYRDDALTALAQVEAMAEQEPVAWAVYWGLPPTRKNSVHFDMESAQAVAKQIKSATEVRPLYAAQVAQQPQAEKELRKILCVTYAGAYAYMDDGEAQDSRANPTIDFMRDTPAEIQQKMQQRSLAQQPQARPDFTDEWTGYLKDGETPFERFLRERKDLQSVLKLYQRVLEENERLKAQQPHQCALCGSDEAFTGACGGGKNNPRALCYAPVAQQPQAEEVPCEGRDYCGRFPFCGCGNSDSLPERDTTKPAEQQGLFRKFVVCRTDGSDAPGGKHDGCDYFVLDVTHDKHAKAALAAYATAVEQSHPQLAEDMRDRYELAAPSQAEAVQCSVNSVSSRMCEKGTNGCDTQHAPQRAEAVPQKPKLIGWRTSDYLMETSDKDKADNWSVHHEMLPIFEGDPYTKLVASTQQVQATHQHDLAHRLRVHLANRHTLTGKEFADGVEATLAEYYAAPKQAEAVQACGHPMSLLLRSAESNESLYCEACDDKSGRHDAERRETELLDANRRLQEKIASADALKLHAIEELCQLGYTVKDGELIPPDHLHKLVEAAGHPLAAPQQAEAVPSSDLNTDEGDPVTLWAEIWRLREAVKGPDGYATWQDAATAERIRRVRAESKQAEVTKTVATHDDTDLIEQMLGALRSCSGVPHWPALIPTINAARKRLETTRQAEAVPDVRNLISQLENAAHNKGELFERHQGKGWPATASERFTRLRDETIPSLRKQLLAAAPQQAEAVPVDMVLYCPKCGTQHIDMKEIRFIDRGPNSPPGNQTVWDNPPHKSHLCHGCGHIWRPSDTPTNGVEATASGKDADTAPQQAEAVPPDVARDAERYRWLRDQTTDDGIAIVMKNKCINDSISYAENINKHIDAAIAQQKGQS